MKTREMHENGKNRILRDKTKTFFFSSYFSKILHILKRNQLQMNYRVHSIEKIQRSWEEIYATKIKRGGGTYFGGKMAHSFLNFKSADGHLYGMT